MKKNWVLTLRIEWVSREWMESILEHILRFVHAEGGSVSGGFELAPELQEVQDEQPAQSCTHPGPGWASPESLLPA